MTTTCISTVGRGQTTAGKKRTWLSPSSIKTRPTTHLNNPSHLHLFFSWMPGNSPGQWAFDCKNDLVRQMRPCCMPTPGMDTLIIIEWDGPGGGLALHEDDVLSAQEYYQYYFHAVRASYRDHCDYYRDVTLVMPHTVTRAPISQLWRTTERGSVTACCITPCLWRAILLKRRKLFRQSFSMQISYPNPSDLPELLDFPSRRSCIAMAQRVLKKKKPSGTLAISSVRAAAVIQ